MNARAEQGDRLIRHIVIVGGGTSGWLAAGHLRQALSGRCRITLIEAPDIATVGVGEATVPSLRGTLAAIGLDEAELLRECNGSFKLAIKFAGWARGGPGDVFWHPFGGASVPVVKGLQLGHHWLARYREGLETRSFAEACFASVALCRAGRAPRAPGDAPYQGRVDYAYHLDALLLADLLRRRATRAGVRRIEDKVRHVRLDARGHIEAVETEAHGPVAADLFIDCSGFRGLLVNQALKEPFLAYDDVLFCDRAVAMRVPLDRPGAIEPYTTATALSAGWCWHIPLATRVGAGYVYSSAHLSPEAAEAELRAFLGPRAAQAEASHIRMRVGRNRAFWVNNCVSLGLAGGFIEPLESTGIFLVEMGIYNLLSYFPDRDCAPALRAAYNRVMRHHYEHIRDFIVLHYCTTGRSDTPFWRANRHHPKIPDSLREKLEFWRLSFPVEEHQFNPGLFTDASYMCLLAGMGRLPKRALPILGYAWDPEAEEAFAGIAAEAGRLAAALPAHGDYIARQRAPQAARSLVP